MSLTWIKPIWEWCPLLTMIPVRENSEVVIMYPDILGKIRMILAPQALLQHHGVLPVLSCQLTQQNLGCAEVDIWCWPHLKKTLVKTLVNPLITGVITHLRAVGWATKLGFKHGKLENQLWKLGKTWAKHGTYHIGTWEIPDLKWRLYWENGLSMAELSIAMGKTTGGSFFFCDWHF